MFINVAATIFISKVYPILSKISYAISCCLPTGKLTTFAHTKFDSKYFICLLLASYEFPCMNSRFGGICGSRDLGSQEISLICFFPINKKIDFYVGDMNFHNLMEFH